MNKKLEFFDKRLFLRGIPVFESNKEIAISFYRNWKNSVYMNEDPIEWCGKNINEVAPATYAIHFKDIKEMKKHKMLFEGIENLRKAKNIKFDVDIPEECMGYFSFDGKLWYMLVQYRSIMMGDTDNIAIMDGAVFDPEKFLQNIEKYTDKITKEDAQNLLNQAELEVRDQAELLEKQVKMAMEESNELIDKIKNNIGDQIVDNLQ